MSIAMPMVVSIHVVAAVMPANAEPLLFAGRRERVEDLAEAVLALGSRSSCGAPTARTATRR